MLKGLCAVYEAMQHFMLHEIILPGYYYVIIRIVSFTQQIIQDFVGEATSRPGEGLRLGRPHKHEEGYINAAKVIRILENTFLRWRELKSAKNLPDDDAMAHYLLDTLPLATPTPTPSTECSFEPRFDLQSAQNTK